ncbi:MAG: DNA repair protein RecN [Oscillospiraceae bacterium]
MLSEIYIENLAVIQKANIPLCENFNIFTGETGAGKSILINGINAILGQRITKDIVRTGSEKAVIIALFKKIPQTAKRKLAEFGIDFSDDEITISREISVDGGSVCRINGRVTTVSILKDLGENLINIHGQHDNQTLLAPEKHLEILDSFGNLQPLLDEYKNSFKMLQETAKKINKLTVDEAEKSRKITMLNEKIAEISQLDLDEDEDASIDAEFEVAKNSDDIAKAILASKIFLNGGDENENEYNIIDQISSSIAELADYSDILPDLFPLTERLNSAQIELTDIFEELTSISKKIDLDPERFAYLTTRREQINTIKRHYGPELSDVLKTYNDAVDELKILENSSTEIEALKQKKQVLLVEVTDKAKTLSKAREQASLDFITQVTGELTFLDMPNVKLEVAHEKGKLTINGMDTIEFLISANLGEPPKSIAKIASGGELSRIMLALKNVIADKDDIPTLIFDEIDTGVSGRAAQKIGIKLAQIAKIRQVICVTHLAQLAIMADNHLLIEKNVIENRTITDIKKLDFEGKKYEIARIMGGENPSELMLKNAAELLNSKNNLLEK